MTDELQAEQLLRADLARIRELIQKGDEIHTAIAKVVGGPQCPIRAEVVRAHGLPLQAQEKLNGITSVTARLRSLVWLFLHEEQATAAVQEQGEGKTLLVAAIATQREELLSRWLRRWLGSISAHRIDFEEAVFLGHQISSLIRQNRALVKVHQAGGELKRRLVQAFRGLEGKLDQMEELFTPGLLGSPKWTEASSLEDLMEILRQPLEGPDAD